MEAAPSQETTDSCCASPKLQQFFKNKSFSICCVLLVNLQCFEMVVLDNFPSFMLVSWKGTTGTHAAIPRSPS